MNSRFSASEAKPAIRWHRSGGFTLLELVLVLLILGIAIIPIFRAFAPAYSLQQAGESKAVFANQARATLSRIAALDYSVLASNQSANVNLTNLLGGVGEAREEAFPVLGSSYMPAVAIRDVTGGTGGLVEIVVKTEGVSLQMLKADY